MGTNEKREATYRCGEYTPDTESVRVTYVGHKILLGVRKNTAEDNFDRWLTTVRAEAKVEALEEAADEINRIDPAWDSALWIEPPGHYVPLPEWLRKRAVKIRERLLS